MTFHSLFPTASSIRTTHDLLSRGLSPNSLTELVRSDQLVRVRRGHYAMPSAELSTVEAVRVGGLLTCASALRSYGLWTADDGFAHVWLPRNAARMRSPRDRWMPLSDANRDGLTLHWWPNIMEPDISNGRVHVVDALRHVVRCQPRPMALAALDSALYEKQIDASQLDSVFGAVPGKFACLGHEIDARSMSGIETILRVALRDAGLSCDVQVYVSGVGRVDLIVEGCIAIETDGRPNHDTAQFQGRDYARDLALALAGYTVLRFNYRQVMFQCELVVEAVRVALANRAGVAPVSQ